jgi:DNA-binding NtrC family response regulator
MHERLLIVEDEETLCESLKRVLSREGYVVDIAYSAESALEIFDGGFYDVIITDIILPGITGIELLKRVKEQLPEQIVIITTAYASLETAVEALRTGAYDYVVKPVMHEEIKQIVKNALTQGALQEENSRLRRQIERQYDLRMIVGECPVMKKIMDEVNAIAESGSNVLITGEIGTGKELIARAVHLKSTRAEKPFIPVNLRTIPVDHLESKLFGYVKGAFAGASTSRKGLFEEASGGTVFFREIEYLNEEIQVQLLRTLENQEVRPVGGTREIKIDLRVISATRMDLESMGKTGKFRKDLFARINGKSIMLPPLRERKEDIEPLARHFIQKYSNDLFKTVKGIDGRALELLVSYGWPGNVRELQNIIERAILLSEDGVITAGHLPQLSSQKI